MDRMFRFVVVAALVAGLFLAPAHAQTFNKKKPKTTTQVWSTDSTDIAIPGERYGKYVWRQVGECKATWFSDGTLKTCEGIEGTKRWRLEDSGDFGDRVFWDPGPGPEPASDILTPSLLATRADGRVTLVSLPSGRQTVTDYSGWVDITDGLLLGGGYYLEGPRVAGQPVTLSALEFDLLAALARSPGRVFSRAQLLEQVWGYRHAADTRLVNVHVQRLRSKVEHDPENPEIVVTVRGVGYKAGTV